MKTIHISSKIHYQLKVKAANKELTLKQLIERILDKALEA